MPSREIQIPLFLWIATAIIVHLLWGGSTHQAAIVVEEKAALRGFAARIQHEVQAELRPIQISMLESDQLVPPKPATPENDERSDDKSSEEKPKDERVTKKDAQPPPEKKPEKKPQEPKQKPQEPPPLEQPKPEEKKPVDLLARAPQAAPQQLDLERQKRIAVRQHVDDPNQADNPDAKFLGEKANRVNEETQAQITSTDQDHPNPTPGSTPNQEPGKQPGNSDESRVASAFGQDDEGSSLPPPVAPTATPNTPKQQQQQQQAVSPTETANTPRHSDQSRPPKDGQKTQEEDPGTRLAPDIVAGDSGDYAMGGPAQPKPKRKRLPPVKATKPGDWFGLGSGATTASGVNLNLSHSDAVAVVGAEQLQADRRMDQLRRRSKRAGAWKMAGIERYRSAIENYVPSVKPGNTTALNTAASPFATYLNDIHNRIHPIFAEDFLGSLGRLSASDPMNRPDLKTEIEIVVSKLDGSLVRRGLTRSSGILQFDVSA
ncbi:MAG TPA: hypothetical protein VIV60_02840, partial [Polyangiaceae bacterium]